MKPDISRTVLVISVYDEAQKKTLITLVEDSFELGPRNFIPQSLHFWSHFIPKGKIVTSYQSLHTEVTLYQSLHTKPLHTFYFIFFYFIFSQKFRTSFFTCLNFTTSSKYMYCASHIISSSGGLNVDGFRR